MRLVAAGARLVVVAALVVAAGSALAGFLVTRLASLGGAAEGVGWGMCVGGALVALVVGQSGSPSRLALGGRWINYGPSSAAAAHVWGRNPALPQSPLWLLAASLLVFAAGIAVVVLTY